jgi:hypothetical protein
MDLNARIICAAGIPSMLLTSAVTTHEGRESLRTTSDKDTTAPAAVGGSPEHRQREPSRERRRPVPNG